MLRRFLRYRFLHDNRSLSYYLSQFVPYCSCHCFRANKRRTHEPKFVRARLSPNLQAEIVGCKFFIHSLIRTFLQFYKLYQVLWRWVVTPKKRKSGTHREPCSCFVLSFLVNKKVFILEFKIILTNCTYGAREESSKRLWGIIVCSSQVSSQT